jgi:hypothetical protein
MGCTEACLCRDRSLVISLTRTASRQHAGLGMEAMGFERRLTTRLKSKKESDKVWTVGASLASIVFIVLTLTSNSMAVL